MSLREIFEKFYAGRSKRELIKIDIIYIQIQIMIEKNVPAYFFTDSSVNFYQVYKSNRFAQPSSCVN